MNRMLLTSAKAVTLSVLLTSVSGFAYAQTATETTQTTSSSTTTTTTTAPAPTTTTVSTTTTRMKDAKMKDVIPCPVLPVLQDGWYLGLQVGYDAYRIRESINLPSSSDIIANPAINASGLVGGLFLGYGQVITSWFYLGGEIFANVSGANVSTTYTSLNSQYRNKLNVNSSYGFSIIPGLKFTPTSLGYIKVGWNWARFKTQEFVVGGSSTSRSATSNGFDLGVGIETLLTGNWSLRSEYNHTFYNSFNSNGAFQTNFNPSDNQYTLGVLYHFS